jgi:hypothetical protein
MPGSGVPGTRRPRPPRCRPCRTCSTKGVNSVPMMPSPTLVTRAKIISARSTRCRAVSRSPSRSSLPTRAILARTGPPDDPGPAVRPLVLTKTRRAAEATKLPASTTVTAIMPPAAARMPPSAEPASRDTLETWPLSALAVSSSPSGTSRGTMACSAGEKNCWMAPSANITAKTIQTCAASRTSSSGSRPAASSRLATIMVRLRSQRSANTPATAPSSTCGANDDAIVSADASVEPVTA